MLHHKIGWTLACLASMLAGTHGLSYVVHPSLRVDQNGCNADGTHIIEGTVVHCEKSCNESPLCLGFNYNVRQAKCYLRSCGASALTPASEFIAFYEKTTESPTSFPPTFAPTAAPSSVSTTFAPTAATPIATNDSVATNDGASGTKPDEDGGVNAGSGNSETGSEPGFMTGVIAGAAVAVLSVAFLLFMWRTYLKKKAGYKVYRDDDDDNDEPAKKPGPPKKVSMVVVGNSGVGKTTLCSMLCNSMVPNQREHIPTIGIDLMFWHRTPSPSSGSNSATFRRQSPKEKGGGTSKVLVWDTAGSARYSDICQPYVDDATTILIVFSLADPKSFEDADAWWQRSCGVGGDKDVILVGNQSDRPRKVSTEKIDAWIERRAVRAYLELSCFEPTDIEKLRDKLVEIHPLAEDAYAAELAARNRGRRGTV